jgi:hypothetical protein
MAFEMSVTLASVTAHLQSLVQVGMNVLLEPEKAADHLLGIPLAGRRAQ